MHLDDLNLEGEVTPSQVSRSLAVTDDRKIRAEMFSTTARLLRKIRKLEKGHTDFLRWDQLLYEDWYNLTFRNEKSAAEQLERRHRTLMTFHLHLKHVAETANVTLARAYLLLKEEEQQYQRGDSDWKFIIERLRQQRVECAKRSQRPAAVSKEKHFVTENLFESAEQMGKEESGVVGLSRQARSVYHYLKDVDDAMMGRHFNDSVAGYGLFREAFQIAMKCGDWGLLVKIWKNSNLGYQQKLLRPMPSHMKDFLNQMVGSTQYQSVPAGEAVTQELALRSIYRKLARLLHPDRFDGDNLELREWSLKTWQKVQVAYRAFDFQSLKKLELMCMAKFGRLDGLTLDEIYESSLVAAEELENLEKSLRTYRKHPAWRFSSRRGYKALIMRIQREHKKRFGPMEAEVEALEKLLKEVSVGEIE